MKNSKLTIQDCSYIVVAVALIAVMISSANNSPVPEFDLLIEVEVKDGDTLWSIANSYSNEISTHTYISLIKLQNNLERDIIYPGQTLLIPIEQQKVVKNESNHLLSSKH